MWSAVLTVFFGCSHRKTTFPLTVPRKPGSNVDRGTYVVCLECGSEFEYDWQAMKIRKSLTTSRALPLLPRSVESRLT